MIFDKNCLIIVRIKYLSMTQFEEKKEITIESIESDLIYLILDLILIDRNLMFFINAKVSCKFWKKSFVNSS